MKKTLLLLPIVATLAACGSTGMTPDHYEKRADTILQRQTQNVEKSLSQAPAWMSKLPSSNNAVFENGTAISSDWSMADHKAKAIAYGKICMAAGGTASQRTKIYNRDTEKGSQEYSEMAMRTSCAEVDLTGVEVKEIKHVSEGNRFRTYVLVALPTGDANVLKRAKREAEDSVSTEERAKKAFNELDGVAPNEEIVTPAKVTPVPGNSVSVIKPDGSSSTLNLMAVDNEAYKAKRAEALQKPGAVVGQVTVNN
jgi:hypothetical protein